jgi:hypothetical protein
MQKDLESVFDSVSQETTVVLGGSWDEPEERRTMRRTMLENDDDDAPDSRECFCSGSSSSFASSARFYVVSIVVDYYLPCLPRRVSGIGLAPIGFVCSDTSSSSFFYCYRAHTYTHTRFDCCFDDEMFSLSLSISCRELLQPIVVVDHFCAHRHHQHEFE